MKIFCLNCGKELKEYKTISEEMDIELKGRIYKYQGHKAVCPVCGEPLFVPEVLQYNKEKAYDAFRKANEIISQEEVLSIPEKFHVSKRNISKYLGWGDVTFSRYCSGFIPTKQNSDILKELISNPEYLMDKIFKYIQEHPDDKSAKRDLQKMLDSETVSEKNKIYRVSEYIIKRLHRNLLPRLRLMKLLYYVQGFNKAINGVFLFDDDCQAWQYGPVYPNVRGKFSDLEIDSSIYLDEIELDKLDLEEDEKAVIDGVLAAFDRFSNDKLIEFTHSETPWLNARNGIPSGERSHNIIKKDDMTSFFTEIVREYDVQEPGDIINYTKDK